MRKVVSGVVGLLLVGMLVLLPAPAHAAGTVTVSVTGQGSATGEGIDCNQSGGPDCAEFYEDTEEQDCDPDRKPPCITITTPPTVQLVAGPDSNGFVYDGWTGCDTVAGRTCELTVTTAQGVQARFRDAQAPSASGMSPGSGIHAGTITLAANASDNAGVTKVEFRVRGALVATDMAAPYSSSFNTTTVADGTASLQATAFDAAGNITATSSSITIDNNAPALNVTGGPNGQTFGPGTTQTWTFTASDVTLSSVQCSVVPDGQSPTYGACSSNGSHAVTNKPAGSYRFFVRARDGLARDTVAERTFVIDGTGPGTTITGGPAHGASVGSSTLTWTFTSDEPGSTTACRVYASGTTPPAYGACSTPDSHTASGLADGTYVFEVRGTDSLGNLGSAVSRSVTVDTAAPDTVLDRKPAKRIVTHQRLVKVRFEFHATEAGARFECKLDARAWTACGSPQRYRLGKGRHVVSIRAIDAAGNVDTSPAKRRFRVVRR